MAQLKLISFSISELGAALDIGPGTHGARCAEIVEGFGAATGEITRDIWRPEENCAGNCHGCEQNYYERQKELRAKL